MFSADTHNWREENDMTSKQAAVAVVISVCSAGAVLGQTEWEHHPDNPVIGPGPAGSWDDAGRSGRAVLSDGTMYHLWFIGVSQSDGFTDIGHATSLDGVAWTMDPANPVLTRGAPGEWDGAAMNGVAVVHDGGQFHMWYSAWNGSMCCDDFWAIGHATSPDGSSWIKYSGNPVMEAGSPGSWDDHVVRPGTVILEDGTYKMWYTGAVWGGASGYLFRVGYAESSDGVDWTRHLAPVLVPSGSSGAWDFPAVGSASVVFDGAAYHMWYYGGVPAEAAFTGAIGYADSNDGLHWTRHPDNPVVDTDDLGPYAASAVFDGTTWHMWYAHWDGTIDWISYATSTCCAGLDHLQFVPAAAYAAGAAGSFYVTDVSVNNRDRGPASYSFTWLPRDSDNADPQVSETFTLEAGAEARYENVLNSVFGAAEGALGAVALSSDSPELLVMSRTYNLPAAKVSGTFGQSLVAIPAAAMIPAGVTRRITFLAEGGDVRSNVGCQNGTDQAMTIMIELHDLAGTSLETASLTLGPWGNTQVNRVFADFEPVSGYVDVWTETDGATFYCYGSVLDNGTSDPTTIPPL
jgi:hypothetical protein